MKTSVFAAIAIVLAMGASALTPAQAAGCLKGAAVGAVAGHVAGGHALVGAGAGCAIGHHEANKATTRSQQVQNSSTPNQAPNTTDSTTQQR